MGKLTAIIFFTFQEQYEEKIDNLNTRLQETEENNKDLKEEINEMKRKSSEEQDQYMMEIRDLTTKCAEFEVQLKDSTQIKSREVYFIILRMLENQL